MFNQEYTWNMIKYVLKVIISTKTCSCQRKHYWGFLNESASGFIFVFGLPLKRLSPPKVWPIRLVSISLCGVLRTFWYDTFSCSVSYIWKHILCMCVCLPDRHVYFKTFCRPRITFYFNWNLVNWVLKWNIQCCPQRLQVNPTVFWLHLSICQLLIGKRIGWS